MIRKKRFCRQEYYCTMITVKCHRMVSMKTLLTYSLCCPFNSKLIFARSLSLPADFVCNLHKMSFASRSVRVAEPLALPTSVHGVAGSNPAGGEILFEPKRRFIAQSLSYSPFHRLEMTEILLKGRKILTHTSIIRFCFFYMARKRNPSFLRFVRSPVHPSVRPGFVRPSVFN